MVLLSVITSAFSVALSPRRQTGTLPRTALGTLAYIVASLLLAVAGVLAFAAWVLLYLVVIAPLAYAGYVLVSFPLREVETSAVDQAIEVTSGETGELESVGVRDLVASSRVDLRNFLIALPAIALSLLLQAPTFF
jgi:hypothetical protein